MNDPDTAGRIIAALRDQIKGLEAELKQANDTIETLETRHAATMLYGQAVVEELAETKRVLNERLIDRDETIMAEGVKRAEVERRLAALSGKKERVVIEVSGGLVTDVHLSDPSIEVSLFDWDNIRADEPSARQHQEEAFEEAIAKAPHTINL